MQTEVEVVNSAKSFYYACVKHLQKPLLQKCQHHILTFEFHNKLKSRPNTEEWPGIPETRKFHSIGNTRNGDVYLRTFSCCCKGCLHGNESCSNDVCPDKWRGYSLSGRKHCQPNHGGVRQLMIKYVKAVKTHICHQKLIGEIELLY